MDMEFEKIINELFLNTYNFVLEGIDEKYKDEIKEAYYNKLKHFDLISEFIKKTNYDTALKAYTELFESRYKTASPEDKMEEFIKDEAYEQIFSASRAGYSYAVNRIKTGEIQITEEEANKNIELIDKNLPLVKKFNEKRAMHVASEGIMDFMFSSGMTSDMSLRAGGDYRIYSQSLAYKGNTLNMKYCINCGNKLDGDVKFCMICGARQPDVDDDCCR